MADVLKVLMMGGQRAGKTSMLAGLIEKCSGIVFNAIKFKIILRMFAVIKRGTPYVETDNYRNGKNKQPGVN